ncbi:methyltransferase domain-containing protein [Streptomyces otsuchiensis]|uniref:methyltransferase domain-containing protein n=1 Tax=Streptomyces otsuchiensis TaxID=2681388 RepID=UPI0014769EA9|nr:methyltransferase domain-containing protein [Streptomyces otsuchiensis]
MTTERGAPCLAQALIEVPRHAFVPPRAWAAASAAGPARWIDREKDADGWWRAVSSSAAIYTQLDDGRTELTEGNAALTRAPTSSSTSPPLVVAFLRRLDPRPGDHVLEIGTGTGWTAGLLSVLVGGSGRVTTVEIDPALAREAASSLATAGHAPGIVVGDGAHGVPAEAPFDRVHVTCGVSELPYAWVEQCRPGGVIVVPHAGTGRLLRLTAHGDGTASGHFHEPCSFMLLRDQRRPVERIARTPERVRAPSGDPDALAHAPPGLQVLLSEAVGDIPFPAGESVLLTVGTSHAVVTDGRVTQTGPRDLWDEAEAVHRWWQRLGRPGAERIGYTVTRDDQYVWLDDPTRPVSRPAGLAPGPGAERGRVAEPERGMTKRR